MFPPTLPSAPNDLSPGFLPPPAPRHQKAFSLVEVVLAIGVVAFAFVAIFSLLPVGMGVFREAMETSVGAQIAQRIVTDVQETDFDNLVKSSGTGDFYALPKRHFDDQGNEVILANPDNPTPADLANNNVIYTARVRGSKPGQGFTSLPSTNKRFFPRGATYLTIQVAQNPGGKNLDIDANSLIDADKARKAFIRLQTYSVFVARNDYPTP